MWAAKQGEREYTAKKVELQAAAQEAEAEAAAKAKGKGKGLKGQAGSSADGAAPTDGPG